MLYGGSFEEKVAFIAEHFFASSHGNRYNVTPW